MFILNLFFIFLALVANLRAEIVSSMTDEWGEHATIKEVL